MQRQQSIWKFLQKHNVVNFVVKTSVAAVVGLISVGGSAMGKGGEGLLAYSAIACAPGNHAYTATGGETWSTLAAHFNPIQDTFIQQNKQISSKALHAYQTVCVPDTTQQDSQVRTNAAEVTGIAAHADAHPAQTSRARAIATPASQSTPTTTSVLDALSANATPAAVSPSDTTQAENASLLMGPAVEMAPASAVGHSNPYPYPQCTWWADQRYYQKHGVFVPWTRSANAWQWNARAADFGWHVSNRPTVGSILVLQPRVQGAGSAGHVAVVEQVLGGGHFIASSMNWGRNPYSVTRARFTVGSGVTFIRR